MAKTTTTTTKNAVPSFQDGKSFFSISLSYVRLAGTRFDLTCRQFGLTKKMRENNVFQSNKITLEVSSQ